MSDGKFPKPWQVTDKNIPWFVSNSHSTFYKWLKLKNNKLEGFENSWMETRGCVWVGESYLRNHKWQIKLLSEFYAIHIQSFTSDSNLRNNNLYGFENSRMDTGGCVWVEKSYLRNDKWQIKLLSDLFFTIHI